uniref:SEC16 homolog A, endoplasmic reticulum export factor n=1 Tax=Pan troglodytes TaxID=9598 RepID=A0A2I3TI28_PANTR
VDLLPTSILLVSLWICSPHLHPGVSMDLLPTSILLVSLWICSHLHPPGVLWICSPPPSSWCLCGSAPTSILLVSLWIWRLWGLTEGESWFFRWLPGKKKTEAYLPDDKNKSIVWDEKKNQWVNLNEPEEEKKAPPPPPTSMPKTVQAAPPALPGPPGAPVNMYSRRAAGTRARYVDVLNPSGTQRSEPALAPADFVAPLAPLPIPSNLFVPTPVSSVRPQGRSGRNDGLLTLSSPDAEEPQLPDRTGREGPAAARGLANPEPAPEPKVLSSAASLPGSELPSSRPEGSQGGELSRCSSMSSLSREVSQHFNQAPGDLPAAGGPPSGAVPFYNPAQLAQACATSGSSRLGRIGQRKHLVLN